MDILLIGDNPLAESIVTLARAAGHIVSYLPLSDNYNPFDIYEYIREGEEMLAIEVVLTDLEAKHEIITQLDHFLINKIPILTAALNASASEVARWCTRPSRVVGFAAIEPFAAASVVELMPALQSKNIAIKRAKAFWQSIGREPVTIADSVGGVLPRIVCNLINEAAYALMEGVATPADIDLAMQLGTNHPRGPLQWADLIGIRNVVATLDAMGHEFGTAQYQPAPLLKQYARAGRRFYD